jgi:site-specific recombinase XerD
MKEDAMTPLRRQMIEDMQLHGYSKKTQECYLTAVKVLARHYRRSPDKLTEEEIREFFLYLVNVKHVARSTLAIYLYAIKFFYEKSLKREWPIFELIRPKKSKKLPVVLAPSEVRHVLSLIHKSMARTALMVIYSCGLRLSEGTNLHVADIDSERMVVRVRDGKGGKDRYVPLAERTLDLLRAYQSANRSGVWLFPSPAKEGPISAMSLQKTFKAALKESGISKNASIHTLRHSYATHLLERGVDIRLIQKILGHGCLTSTFRYTHLTRKTITNFQSIINDLMADL